MSAANELKSIFTQYWQFMALRAGCQVGLFDALSQINRPTAARILSEKLALNLHSLSLLLEALVEFGAVSKTTNNEYQLTEKGALLAECNPDSLKNACLLWGEEHLDAWRNLPASLRSGQPAFDLTFGEGFFDYISRRPASLENYQRAMAEYARDDYTALPDLVDFSRFKTVADVGGGTGKLVQRLAKKWPATNFILFERPEVLDNCLTRDLVNVKSVGGDFFLPLPFEAEAIILARVLHDWPDETALKILQNCYRALPEKGQVYILEILGDEVPTPALNLHMNLICGSRERTTGEYEVLLSNVGFVVTDVRRLNSLQSILIAKKNHTDYA